MTQTNNNDRWSSLSMQERAQLLGIYASKGYTDLAKIISHYNSFATGGQMNTNGPDDPEEDKIYTARPLNEVQIIGQRNPVQANILQQHLDNVNSFYYNDVVPRLQREHQGLKTKPDINFPYLNIEDIDFDPIWLGKDKAAAFVNPIFPSKIHSYVNPESRYFDEDMTHENSHRWQFEHPKRDKQYKDKSKEMLRQAYGNWSNKFRNAYKDLSAFIKYEPNRNLVNIEYEADNRAVRYNIWREYRDLYNRTPTIEELDKYIDEMPEDRLYKYFIKPSGYLDIQSTVPKFGDRNFNDKLEYFNENMKTIKEALKHVAQNNTTEDTVHYAALGGHLYQDGGLDNPKKKPEFKQSEEQYYDRNNDIIYAQDSIGEGYQHEYFHARPNTTLLNNLRPYYENLNDNRLIELGADLPFVKRVENDPNHFYSPEEIGARVTAAKYMLNKAGVNTIDTDFLKNARQNELQYGDNFRDLLHMYNDENLSNILNIRYDKGGKLGHITPYGQWQYPYQVTTIPSNNITMKGVDYPVIGVSNTGDTKYMLPNMDYLFDGNYVTEYPVHKFQNGGPDDDKTFVSSQASETGWMPEVQITADRPEWQKGLTNYDWDRARRYYSDENGYITPEGFTFLKNVASKNRTGKSNFMRDVNKLSYIPNAAVGAIGAIPAAAGLIAATTNPVVDAVLTTHGLITAPKNIKEGIQDIQEGNTWQGIGELGLTALDLTGAGQLLGRTGRMFNKGYRAKHAYNTIMPASYDNPIQRGKEWVRDMWYNEPVDMKTPKWFKQTKTQRDLADSSKMPYEQANMTGYTNTAGYITPGTENAAKIADEARLDAWAIYNGLEPQYGTYIKNADGTYSYDLARIRRISNDTWNPAYTPDNIPFNIKLSAGNGQDFVTGAGGGLTDFRILGTDTHGNGIMRIEDVWDLHPFSRSSDVLSKRIQKKLFPNWEEKFANPMFEKASRVLDWGLSHNSKRIENLGNKMFDASDKPLFGLLEKIDDKMKNFEVGKLTGGKPFKMSTNIKYHLEDPLLSRLEMDELGNMGFNSGKRVLHYGFTPDYIANIKPIEKDLYNAYDLGVLKDMLKNITKEK